MASGGVDGSHRTAARRALATGGGGHGRCGPAAHYRLGAPSCAARDWR
jgi:hypothetical protein